MKRLEKVLPCLCLQLHWWTWSILGGNKTVDAFSLICILLSQFSLQPYFSFSICFAFWLFCFSFDGHMTNMFNLLELFNIRCPLWRAQLYTAVLTLRLKFIIHSQILQAATHLEAYMHYIWFWSNSVIAKIFKGCFAKGMNIARVKVKQSVPLGIPLQALNKIVLNSWDVNFLFSLLMFLSFHFSYYNEPASWSGSNRRTTIFLSTFWNVSWKLELTESVKCIRPMV